MLLSPPPYLLFFLLSIKKRNLELFRGKKKAKEFLPPHFKTDSFHDGIRGTCNPIAMAV
jgi:hypothetical protein